MSGEIDIQQNLINKLSPKTSWRQFEYYPITKKQEYEWKK